MAAPSFNSTMAAGLKPFLRESVNAVRGAGLPVDKAAKVGNATIFEARGQPGEGISAARALSNGDALTHRDGGVTP